MGESEVDEPLQVDGGDAVAESFWASLKRECIHGRAFATRAEARRAIFRWINWYNSTRLHTSLDGVPPIEWEQHYLPSGSRIEGCDVAHHIVAPFGHRRRRRAYEATNETIVVHRLDEHTSARLEHPGELVQHPPVVVIIEVPKEVNQQTTASNGPDTGRSRRSPCR